MRLHQLSDRTTEAGLSEDWAFQHELPCMLRFEVEDTGQGIPLESLASLFQPFDKVETCHQIDEGIGLGLTISQRLVNLLGGEITVQIVVGEGSIFSFEIQVHC